MTKFEQFKAKLTPGKPIDGRAWPNGRRRLIVT